MSYHGIATLPNASGELVNIFAWRHLFDIASLPAGNLTIRAIAYDGKENSSETSVTCTLYKTLPDTPNDFSISSTSENIGLIWTYPNQQSGSYFSKFNVYRSTSINGDFIRVGGNNGVNFFDTTSNGIIPASSYYYYVTAEDSFGNESIPTATLQGILQDDIMPPTIFSYIPSQNTSYARKPRFLNRYTTISS